MPVIAGRTREQIRVSTGYNLSSLYVSEATAAGSTSTLKDSTLIGSDDEHKGKWIILTSGANNDGHIARVTAYTASTTLLTYSPLSTDATADGDTYELWNEDYDPRVIHELINQAIVSATGRAWDPVENVSLFADGYQTRFVVPSGVDMINRIEYRTGGTGLKVHSCDAAWDEATDADFTISVDDEDYKRGSGANRFVVVTDAAANDLVADSITSLDISGYTHIEFWAKSTVAEAAGGLQILLDNTASCASPVETLNVPALVADTWKYCRVALANPELDTAIISVGLKYVTDIGACTIWLDDIKVTHQDKEVWSKLDKVYWNISKEAREIILTGLGRSKVAYALLKLSGGKKPTVFTADTGVATINDSFIINRSTELALMYSSGGGDPEKRRELASYYAALSQQGYKAFPMMVDARMVD